MHRRDTVTKAIVNVDLKKVRDNAERVVSHLCLLYTSDAADE